MKLKILSKFLITIFFLLINFNAFSEIPLAYVDLNYIINKSNAGISLNKKLIALNTKNNNSIKKIESELLQKEKKLISEKKIIKEEDFKAKVLILRKEITAFSNKRLAMKKKSSQVLIKSQAEFIKQLNPIFVEYSKKNSISMLIQKKNIIIGKTELDVTQDILDIVNKKIKKINIK